MKTCNKCHIKQDKSQFTRTPNTKDNLRGACKTCDGIYKHEHYLKNMERAKSNSREWRINNKDRVNATSKKQRERHPRKIKSRKSVCHALTSGRLSKGVCEVCGSDKVQAHHHKGYAPEFALDIQWLCMKHHREADKACIQV